MWLGVACVAFFALEVLLKLMAEGDRPLYFNDGTTFDFVLAVAGVATLCVGGSQNLVVSLLRMLRLVQLSSSWPTSYRGCSSSRKRSSTA